jgi:hypothetical protein
MHHFAEKRWFFPVVQYEAVHDWTFPMIADVIEGWLRGKSMPGRGEHREGSGHRSTPAKCFTRPSGRRNTPAKPISRSIAEPCVAIF